MGSYNSTCQLTNLPICSGDPVVAVLVRTGVQNANILPTYANYQADFMCLPFEAVYSDRNNVEDIRMDKATRSMLLHESYRTEDNQKQSFDSIEDLLYHIAENQVYVKHPSGSLVRLQMALFHKQAYLCIAEDIARRIPMGRTDDFRTCWMNALLPMVAEYCDIARTDDWTRRISMAVNLYLDTHLKAVIMAYVDEMADADFSPQKFTETFVEYLAFYEGFQLLRKGFGGICGAGDQSCELKLHMILADFVNKFCANKQFMAMYPDEEPLGIDFDDSEFDGFDPSFVAEVFCNL